MSPRDKRHHKDLNLGAIYSDNQNFVYIACLRGPDVNSGHLMVLACKGIPCAHRAMHLNRVFGVGNLWSLARPLSLIQYRREDLQLGAPGHLGPGPPAVAAPQPNVPPAPQGNV